MKVTNIEFVETDRMVDCNGRTFIDFEGSAVVEGTKTGERLLPFEMRLISSDGSIKGSKGKYSVSVEFCPASMKADITGLVDCRACSGNWGTSDPETAGLFSIAMGEALIPLLETRGFQIFDGLGHKGGISLRVSVSLLSEVEAPARRFYTAVRQTIDCPICGRVKQKVSEFNA